MIDIHTHILPGVDDGAKTLEESVAMVRVAAEAGTSDIVATPHSNLEYEFDPELVDRKLGELREACGGLIRIHSGCDFHLHYDNIQEALANPSRFTVNGKCYLLVEFSDLMVARTTGDVFHRMRLAGLVPIVTHPERNALLQQRLAELRAWVDSGCYLQVTAQSLLGRFGKGARAFSEELLKQNLVHFVASDAHDCIDRPPRLDEAYRHIEKKYGRERAERLCVLNPSAVIEGTPIPEVDVEPPEPPRKWYHFWS